MGLLTINCGSSTLKWRFYNSAGETIAGAVVETDDHAVAAIAAVDAAAELGEIGAVGHRVVHGGREYDRSVVIDRGVLEALRALVALAPLHNAPAIAAIEALHARLGGSTAMVAVFDTSFHRTMPDHARLYAIDPESAQRHGIERFGFHGLAHRSMLEGYCADACVDPTGVRLVTLQLGNGASAAAIAGGRSVDTSMGLTPLGGLVMGTRAGDVDPTLASFIAQEEGVSVEAALETLTRRSGLLGVSGVSADMRLVLESAAAGDRRSILAIEMFCYRTTKYVGAYLAALGGADAIVFGGGIGENCAVIRDTIMAPLRWTGVPSHVVAVDEEAIIAGDTRRVLGFGPDRDAL